LGGRHRIRPRPVPRGSPLVRWTRRTASAVLAVVSTLALTAPAATAAPTTDDPLHAAAGWLATELVDGERMENDWGADAGLTADVVLALSAAGVAAAEITAATDWLEAHAPTYTGVADEEAWAGAMGKLLLVAATTGRPADDFGHLDLVAALESREEPSGRFTDDSSFGDFSNVITQALAVLGLHRTTGAAPSDLSVSYLATQACEDGGFPSELDVDPAACLGNADATGFAIQALLPLREDPEVDATVAAAVAWLLDEQADDGSFGGPESAANSNSTGLAAAALAAADETAATERARTFLVSLQAGCEDADPGSIRFDAADAGDRDRSTPQAVMGLAGAGLVDASAGGASPQVPLLDCEDDAPASQTGTDEATDPPTAAETDPDAEAADTTVVATGDADEPREGTEAAPGELPRTGGAGTVLLAALGVALLAAGLTTLRRTAGAAR
jgi:LPXTG-motif cell wall-anchored protein